MTRISQKAQVSLEYLIILAAFFGFLGVLLPIVFSTTEGFLLAGDDLLAKRIITDASEQFTLMSFLGDGSKKTFEYSPIKKITVSSEGTNVIISSESKLFKFDLNFPQVIIKEEFSSKFFMIVEKEKGIVGVSFEKS